MNDTTASIAIARRRYAAARATIGGNNDLRKSLVGSAAKR
jgi:hypothetical protein